MERFLRGLASFARLIIFDSEAPACPQPYERRPNAGRTGRRHPRRDGCGRLAAGGPVRDVERGVIAASSPPSIRAGCRTSSRSARPRHLRRARDRRTGHRSVVRHWGNGEIIEKVHRASPTCPRSGRGRLACSTARCHRGRWPRLDPDEHDLRRATGPASLTAPTLVLHRTGDLLASIREGGTSPPTSPEHGSSNCREPITIPYFEDADHIVDLIEEFVTGRTPSAASVRRPPRPAV